jgi:hypothetical protein
VSLALNGHPLHSLTLRVGELGVWTAECRLVEAPDVMSTIASLRVGDTELQGTIIESQIFGLALGARVVGGAGGWAKVLKRASYHNDAGVKALTLAEDAAREAGETLGTFKPGTDRVGVDYARRVASAASVLEYAAGGVPWFVDYQGVTRVEPRAGGTVPADAYTMLAYDPVERVAVLAVDDFAAIVPGRTLVDPRMTTPMVIRDIELTSLEGGPLRATVWCGASPRAGAGRLGDLFQAVVERLTCRELHGLYRYRVVTMRDDLRVDLQAVRLQLGLPDLQAVSQSPGVPGLAAQLTEGCEVLVQFIDGDCAAPIITHYAGPGSSGFAPVGIVIGDDEGMPAARQGDSVEVLLPPALFNGVIGVAPATGVITWTLGPKADGQITGGSGKVRIA